MLSAQISRDGFSLGGLKHGVLSYSVLTSTLQRPVRIQNGVIKIKAAAAKQFIVRKGSNFFKQRQQSGQCFVVPTSKKQRTEAVLLVVRLNAHGKFPIKTCRQSFTIASTETRANLSPKWQANEGQIYKPDLWERLPNIAHTVPG
jgi:hypothetical protein